MQLQPWRMAVMVAAGMALGFAWNAWSGRGLSLAGNAFIRPGEVLEEIDAREAKRRLDRGAIFFDARPLDFYQMSHIPGAQSLPEPDFEAAFVRLEPVLRSRFDLVVYCTAMCDASHQVARRLRDTGIHAAILIDGLPAWTDAGYPVREGKEP
jgi:rhodanese-related sulfurtransferase